MLLLVSAAAVVFMLFGLALFYAGQTGEKSVTNTLLMSFGAFAVVLPLWNWIGFRIGFGSGDTVFLLFQGAFAVIATALISGSVAERMKFGAWMAFAALWSVLVYAVLVQWTWNSAGWLFKLGAVDLAGGGPIHIASGAAGVVLATLLGQRLKPDAHARLNVPLVILGAGILTFGWIFFNAGSVLQVNAAAYQVALNTMLAAATGALGWFVAESLRHKAVTALSGASGAVAGLVAITPAAATLSDWQSGLLGAVAAFAVYGVLQLKDRLPVDDALDVAAFHLVAGVVGSLSIGVVTGWHQLGVQALAVAVTIAYSAGATLIIGLLLKFVFGMRIDAAVEQHGIDSVHRLDPG